MLDDKLCNGILEHISQNSMIGAGCLCKGSSFERDVKGIKMCVTSETLMLSTNKSGQEF